MVFAPCRITAALRAFASALDADQMQATSPAVMESGDDIHIADYWHMIGALYFRARPAFYTHYFFSDFHIQFLLTRPNQAPDLTAVGRLSSRLRHAGRDK